jgi:hypothetical protein
MLFDFLPTKAHNAIFYRISLRKQLLVAVISGFFPRPGEEL